MKSALLVGIGNYPGMRPMPGCVNDADDVETLLLRFGFDPAAIDKPVYPETFGAAIKARLQANIAALKNGDEFIFYFSGHGVKYPLQGGDHDGLCGLDFAWDRRESVILDDDISHALSGLADGARVTLVVDACHSGGLQPNYAYLLSIAEAPPFRIKTYPVPADIAAEIARLESLQQSTTFADAIMAAPGAVARDVVLFAACAPEELAADTDFGDRPNGVMTYAAVRRLNALGAAEDANATLAGVRADVAALNFPQTAQLHGRQVLFVTPLIR